jgi:hypothetical protein
VQAVYQVGLEKGHQHIARAEDDHSQLEKDEKERKQSSRSRRADGRAAAVPPGRGQASPIAAAGRECRPIARSARPPASQQHRNRRRSRQGRGKTASPPGPAASGERPSGPVPDGLNNDGHHDRLGPVEQPLRLGQAAIAYVGPGQGQRGQRGGQDEACARDGRPIQPARLYPSAMATCVEPGPGNRLQAPTRSRNCSAAHPSAPLDGLALHQADMRGRASEGGQAQAQKEPEISPGGSCLALDPITRVPLDWYQGLLRPDPDAGVDDMASRPKSMHRSVRASCKKAQPAVVLSLASANGPSGLPSRMGTWW